MLTDFAFEEAFVGPMQKSEVAAVDHEPRRAGVGLDDVFELGASVLEAGGRVLEESFAEDFVEVGGLDFEMAGGVDLGGKLKELGDVLASDAAGDENGGVGEEVEILLELIEDMVGISDKVGLGENDNNALAGVDDLAGEGLVEFGVGFGGVNKEGADVGFFDGGESAEGGEFFDADFAFAGAAEAGGVEEF